MPNFKKNKSKLFKALRNIIEENLKYSTINVYDDAEIADVIIELTDKKRHRLLKKMLKEFDNLVKDIHNRDSLEKQESEYNKQSMREAVENVSKRIGSD